MSKNLLTGATDRDLWALLKSIPGKIRNKTVTESIPSAVLKEAQATGDFSKIPQYAQEFWAKLPGEEKANILRTGENLGVKRTVPRFGEVPAEVKPS